MNPDGLHPSVRACRRSVLHALPLLLLLASCRDPLKTSVPAAKWDPLPGAAPRAREADDAGRFLVGLPGRNGTAFTALQAQPVWEEHSRELDRAWKEAENGPLPGIREFQSSELSNASITGSSVFYPFSGPDSLMVTTFFPRNPVYVLVGLEPPGTLPTAGDFTGKDLGTALTNLRETVYSVIHRSFFVTREMDREFRGQVTNGLLPPILHLLVRSGRTIAGYRYVRIGEDGQVIESAADPTWKYNNKGLQVDFTGPESQDVQRLFYFSVNLSDEKLRGNRPFLAFLANLKDTTTYMKATSYMPHHPEFSIIRDHILAASRAILQDDSGIPYRYLATAPWSVQLYGDYNKPLRTFHWLEQPDLRKAYAIKGRKNLGFQIGYGFGRMPSNLLLARRAAIMAGKTGR